MVDRCSYVLLDIYTSDLTIGVVYHHLHPLNLTSLFRICLTLTSFKHLCTVTSFPTPDITRQAKVQ